MSFDPTAMGYPMPGAQVLELLIGLEIDEFAAGSPRLGPGAPWVRHLPDALERAEADAAHYARAVVMVTAVYPLTGDPEKPPDVSVSDFEPDFPEYVLQMFDESPWRGLLGRVDVREEWQPGSPFKLKVGIYGLRLGEGEEQDPAGDA